MQQMNASSPFPPNLNTVNILGSSKLIQSAVHGKSTGDTILSSLSYESSTASIPGSSNLVGSSQLVESNVHRKTTDHVASTNMKGDTEVTSKKSSVLDVLFKDCEEAYTSGNTQDGVYKIAPTGWTGSGFSVLCDMTNDGGGWTVSNIVS